MNKSQIVFEEEPKRGHIKFDHVSESLSAIIYFIYLYLLSFSPMDYF